MNKTELRKQFAHGVPARERGVGIIEVLVALVVVSIGVLGMASLQLTGMKHSSGGYNRTKALLFAQNMSTRMRINSAAVASQSYAGFDSTALDCGLPPAPYCQARPGNSQTADCDSEQLAAFDLFSVACGDIGSNGAEEGVNGSLPGGRLQVECIGASCSADSIYEVTVTWAEGRARTTTNEVSTRRVQVRLRP